MKGNSRYFVAPCSQIESLFLYRLQESSCAFAPCIKVAVRNCGKQAEKAVDNERVLHACSFSVSDTESTA